MKIFRNRIILSVLCFLLAGLTAFILLPRLYNNKEATTTIIRAARAIPAGTCITDRDIEKAEVGAFNLQPGTISDSALVVGQYALVSMLAGDTVIDKKLSAQQYESLLDKALSEGKSLVTVSISSIAAGVGGHLQPGNFVSVYVYTSTYVDGETVNKVEAPAILSSLLLYDLENSKGKSVGNSGLLGTITDDDSPRSATFLVDAKQAKELIQAEYSGSIHLVFSAKGEDAP